MLIFTDYKMKKYLFIALIGIVMTTFGVSATYLPYFRLGNPGTDDIEAQKNICLPEKSFEQAEDRNDITRFLTLNENSGNNATAAVTVHNDVGTQPLGYRASFGIASSTWNQAGGFGPNSASLAMLSPAPLVFTHVYDDDWIWTGNPTDDGTLANTVETMRLNAYGDLTITGDLDVDGVMAGSLSLASSEATIASGVITYATFYMAILGEGSANDEIDTINGGTDGTVLNIFPGADEDIKLKDGTGNLNLGADCNLKTLGHKAELRKMGTDWDLIVCIN